MFAWLVEEIQIQRLGHDQTSERQTSKDGSRFERIFTRANFRAADGQTTVVEFEVGGSQIGISRAVVATSRVSRSAGLQVED